MQLAVPWMIMSALAIGQTTQETPPAEAPSSAPIGVPATAAPSRNPIGTTEPFAAELPPVSGLEEGCSGAVPPLQPAPTFDRAVSLRLLLPNLVSDQGRIWSSPARVLKRHNWIPVAVVLG